MRLLNWYLMRFCVDLLIGYWRTRRRALQGVLLRCWMGVARLLLS